MPSESHILTVPSLQGLTDLPTVMAYGDLDDHLRLTVLLATQLSASVDPKLVEMCQARAAPWLKRKRALQNLLREAQARSSSLFVRLVDPDALDIGEVSPRDRWDDATFQRERSEFFNLLLDSFAEGGWELVRQEPRPWTTSKLDSLDGITSETPRLQALPANADARRLDAALQPVSAAVRPLLQSLVDDGRLHAREAARMLEASTAPQIDDLVLEMAYDALSPNAIEAAKRLALLRGPQHWNGVAGPFEQRADATSILEAGPAGIPRAAVRELVENRWVDVFLGAGRQHQFLMANALRRFLLARAAITQTELLVEEHRWLASREPEDVSESVEIHHHAVESLDPVLARDSARYYGADLRRIAFDLSKNRSQYPQAAEVYRLIVNEFDADDAYAWEYLGFNLACSHDGKELPPGVRDEIRNAYVRASKLDPDNPLYKGRELGFRVRIGERVNTDFKRYLRRFRGMGPMALSFFSKPVFEPMEFNQRHALIDECGADDLMGLPELKGLF